MNRKQRRKLKRDRSPNPAVSSDIGTKLREAVAVLHRGQPANALDACIAVLDMQPDNSEALGMAGIAAFHAGRHNQALQFLKRAVRTAPQWNDGWFNFGIVLSATGDYHEARDAFQRANRLAPRNAATLNNLAAIALTIGPIDEALEFTIKAIKLDPDSVDAWVNLGNIYRVMENSREAVTAFQRVLDLDPNDVGALIGYAMLLEETNELDEMAGLIKRLERSAPDDFRVLLLGAKHARRGENFDDALERLESIDLEHLSPSERQAYHFELGRVLDRLHRTDDAWGAFVAGNRAAYEAKPKDIDGSRALKEAETLRSWIETVDTSPWNCRSSENDAGDSLVFLVGFPRSGTTLLDQILSGHPRLVTIEEKPTVHRMINRLRQSKHNYPDSTGTLPDDVCRDLAEVYWQEAEKHARIDEGQILIDKFPLMIQHVALISKVFPKARFLIALRHPLDCCLSSFIQEFSLNSAMANFLDLEETVRFYEAVMGGWIACRERFPIAFMESRYEDLVDDIEASARAIIDFIGVEWNPAVLKFEETARSKPNIKTPSYSQVVEGLYRRARYRWKRYEPFLADARQRLEPFASAFAYDDGGDSVQP